jgi:hypothetical protein
VHTVVRQVLEDVGLALQHLQWVAKGRVGGGQTLG